MHRLFKSALSWKGGRRYRPVSPPPAEWGRLFRRLQVASVARPQRLVAGVLLYARSGSRFGPAYDTSRMTAGARKIGNMDSPT